MPTLMVRYKVKEEGVPEVLAAVQAAFAAIEAKRPPGLRFEYFHQPEGHEFFGLLELEEGAENPLLGIPEARALQATVARHALGGAPTPQPWVKLGSHGFAR
ncbi:hypothetical protein OWM54_10725 [Myxococcus sp. MISCRS1]|jgi:hypothetical protein|uniref:hypothetical protein n=1 Tax=Myxococcus TaxID=32 RepID=UPI001CBB3EE4|nr:MULTISPECIES: hypothetical protein [unclassified Myxococcus]MBZ4399892.1 hypothetical protein [Myxococcus sp. AS-1-15]MBZ4409957.1 hypothetical protein [Myxococcus sp. XM-1-1-1]MCY0997610.1 hypothetical protein [Myxococcus sp. MISCRS1]